MRRISLPAILILLTLASFSCATGELYRYERIRKKDYKIPVNQIRVISFFINKKTSWYGETDRFYARFYTLEPVFEYFRKELLARLNIFVNPKRDYTLAAKSENITLPDMPGYTSVSGRLVLQKNVDYYQLVKRISKENEHYMIIEQHFEVVLRGADNRTALLDLKLYIMNREGEIVFANRYSGSHAFDREDYADLVSFQKHNRERIQKRIMYIYTQLFLKMLGPIISDISKLVRP